MFLSKRLMVIVVAFCLLLTPIVTYAGSARVYSLSLNTNDYWILPDFANIYTNPAYINVYPQSLEFNAANYQGKPAPFSSFTAKVDERVTLGITLGYPQPSFFNPYCAANPGGTFKNFDSQVEFNNDSGLVIPAANPIETSNILFHFGYVFDELKIGISASYIGLNSQDVTEDPPPGTSEIRSTAHQDYSINIGLLTGDIGPLSSMAVNIGGEFPSLTRRYSKITATASDIREISATDAWIYKLGFAGTLDTTPDNSLTFSLNYSSSYYPSNSFERRDNNNDGDFTDPGEEGSADSFLAERYSIKFGISDRLKLSGNGLLFAGVYGHIFKFKQYATGLHADGSQYDNSIYKSNRFTVPVIIGGEFRLTDWLVARISGVKNIITFTKWYDESTSAIPYTDFTSEAGDSYINAGIGIYYKNFSADLCFETPWSGNSDAFAGDFNGYTATRLSLAWKF